MPPFQKPENQTDTIYEDGSKGPNRAGMTPEQRVENFGGSLLEQSVNKKLESLPSQFDDDMVINPSGFEDGDVDDDGDGFGPGYIEHTQTLPMLEATPIQYTPTGQPTGIAQEQSDPDSAYLANQEQDERDAAMRWLSGGEVSGERRFRDPDTPNSGKTVWSMLYDGVGDVATGVFLEPGAWLAGGAYKAVDEIVQSADPIVRWLDKNVASGESLGFKDWSKVDPDTGLLPEGGIPNLFGLKDIKPETTTGALLEGITRFLTGFAIGGGIAKTAGYGAADLLGRFGAKGAAATIGAGTDLIASSRYGFAAAKSVFSDYAAFDGHEARLADLIQQFPALQNPVTEFLQSNPNDSQAFGRMKNVVEGLLVDIPMGVVPFMLGLDSIRKVRYQSDIKKLKAEGESYADAARRIADDVIDPTTGQPRDPMAKAKSLLGDGPELEQSINIDPVRARMAEKNLQAPMIDATNLDQVRAVSDAGKNPYMPDATEGVQRWFYVTSPDERLAKRAGYSSLEDATDARDLLRKQGENAHVFAYDVPIEKAMKGVPVKDLGVPGVRGKGDVAYLDFNPNTPLNMDYAGKRFNLGTLDTEADLNAFLDGTGKGLKEEGRLGDVKLSDAEMRAQAGDINAFRVLTGKSESDILNAPETMRLRQLWSATGRKAIELAEVVSKGGDTEAQYAFMKAMSIHEWVTRRAKKVAEEQGRALRQWQLMPGNSKQLLDQMQELIERSGGDFRVNVMAQKVAALAENPAGLSEFILKSRTARTFDALREFWINSILSGPQTHLVNSGSNLGVLKYVQLERWLAGKIGSVLDPVTGVQAKEAAMMAYGQRQAFKDALRNMSIAWKTGNHGYGLNKVELPFDRAFSSKSFAMAENSPWGPAINYMGSIINMPARALGAADEFFKTLNYRAELHAYALRTATQEAQLGKLTNGLDMDAIYADPKLFADFEAKFRSRMADIVRDPPSDVADKMRGLAQYNTFTSPPGPWTRSFMNMRNMGGGVGQLIVPFVNTPMNILKFSFDRTPFAALRLLSSEYRAMIAKGGAEANIAMARIGLGTAVMATAYDLATDGHITGSGPKTGSDKAKLYRGGWQPYSVRIMTETNADGTPVYRYFAVNRLEPLGLLISYAADLAELSSAESRADADMGELFAATVFSAVQALRDKSFLQGFSNMVEAIENPPNMAETFIGNIVGGFMPNVLAQPNRSIIDPVMRQTATIFDRFKARTPGWSKELAPRRDFWGREIDFNSGLGSAYDLISPIRSRSTKDALEIDRELYRIGYSPKHLRAVQFEGRSVPLHNRPEVLDRYIQLKAATSAEKLIDENPDLPSSYIRRLSSYGDMNLREYLDALVRGDTDESDDYFDMDAEQRKNRISRIISHYNKAASMQVIREYPVIEEIRNKLGDKTNDESRFY